ncbi:MAG: SGNH/GDSL hydrolase family protein [Ferruginibacter sp.]
MLYNETTANFITRRYKGRCILHVRIAFMVFVLLIFCFNGVFAQSKRMVAIGSSTTAGFRTTSVDSSWFGRFKRYYQCQMEVMDSCFNYGVPGDDVYYGMPSHYLPPNGRPSPDVTKNVSKAVAELNTLSNPDNGVVIVNYPTNGYNIYSVAEIMNCLQLIYDSVIQCGNRCFITTTQPRADSLFRSSVMKKKLAEIKDSTISRFGVGHTLNFWDGMYNPADTTILPIYSAGDEVHFNDAGHRILFERVLAKNVFSLPVWYAASSGDLNLLTTWGFETDGSGTHPSSFTTDGQVFIVVNNLNPTINANWNIGGKNTQLVLGDGIRPVLFKIPAAYTVTMSSPSPAGTCR